ncbi:MAG: diphthine--ammonia ligase [bacterium]|nr:diphthine--ammonia ligase [bacterium]
MKIFNSEYTCDTQTKSYFVSWSGGKDSTLALYRAKQMYGPPKFLMTVMNETGERSAGHGLHRDVLIEQAKCLEIPILFCHSCGHDYEAKFQGHLSAFKNDGIEMGVFGDIHLDRSWVDTQCETFGMKALEPLWLDDSKTLIKDIISQKFKAQVIAVAGEKMSPDFLGQTYSWDLIPQLKENEIDPLGEQGEFHTIVTDGPLFKRPLKISPLNKVKRGNHWFLDVEVQREHAS